MLKLNLKVKKFLGITEVDLTFDKPLSMIQGENGSAKTSILDAMRYPLGIPIRNTAASRRGRLGHDDEQFSTEFGFGKKKLKATASSVPKVDSVAKAFGVSRKALPYFMEPSLFLTAEPKDLKALYSEVLNLDVDWKKECIKHKCSKEFLAELGDDMKGALKEATEQRATCKAGKGESPSKPVDPDVAVKDGTQKASEIKMGKLEKALSDVNAHKEKLVEKHAVILDRQVSEKERKAAQKELAQLQEKLENLPDVGDLQTKLDAKAAQKQKLEVQHNELLAKQKAHDALGKKIKGWLGNVDLCATCMKKLERHELKEKGAGETLEGHMEKTIEKISHLVKEEGRIREQIAEADDTEINRRMAELEVLAVEPISDGEIADLKKEINALDTRLQAGYATRDAVRDYLNELAEYEKAIVKHEQQGANWKAWDRICKAIPQVEKDGVAAGLNPLRKLMAKHRILEGKVEISDDLEFSYDGRPFDLLSKAEKYIVSLSPYLATIELFEFLFAVVDDGDFIVTRKLRANLQKVLRAMSKIMPVIFFQARADDEIEATAKAIVKNDMKGVALYHAKGGTAERIAG